MAVQLRRRLFTVDEYYRMGQAAILVEDDRVELLEGQIVEMGPLRSWRQATVDRQNWLFSSRVTDRAMICIHGPVRLSEDSEPQPDFMLLRRRDDFYESAHPEPNDVLLLIEVSDTSTEYDREVKLPLYARYGIAEVWLVGLEAETVETFRSPTADGYQEATQWQRGQRLSPIAFPGLDVAVDDIWG